MARYQIPPDPRDSELRQKRPRRQRSDGFDWVPLAGLGLGLLVTGIAVLLAWQLAQAFLVPDELAVVVPEATIIRQTAPATPEPTPTTAAAAPTVIPTATPAPTVDLSVAPAIVTVGYYAAVANTGGVGVTVRGGPSTSNVRLTVADEGAALLVIGGPTEGSGLTWWQVLIDDAEQTEGWVAADFLTPAGEP